VPDRENPVAERLIWQLGQFFHTRVIHCNFIALQFLATLGRGVFHIEDSLTSVPLARSILRSKANRCPFNPSISPTNPMLISG
jgi:hypothetical protein